MVAKDDLLEKFQITGCENLSDEVLQKCVELCQWYDVDEEEFIDMWLAYGIGHLGGNLEPTLKALEEMQRMTPRNKDKDFSNALNKSTTKEIDFTISSKPEQIIDEENEILGIYAASNKFLTKQHQSQLQTKGPVSPDLEDSEFASGYKATDEDLLGAPSEHQQPTATADFSQSSQFRPTQPGGKVLASFGPKIDSWTNTNTQKFTIRRAGPHVPSNACYMFELLKATSEIRTRICRTIGFQICSVWAEQKNDDVFVTWNVRTRNQKSFRTWGRVCFESETKMSNPTVLLEGCRKPPKVNNTDTKLWPQVELDLGELRECNLFPGQIIAVEGHNVTESLLKVQDIYKGSFIPVAKPPQLVNQLNVIVAAGPFTQPNDLSYQPLWELMAKVAEEEPHVLILIGPFLDFSHPHVQKELLTCTYQEFFNRLVAKVKNCIAGKCTQVVMVASSRDVHHHPVYPTPEYFLPKSIQGPEIHVLPDPCTLDIDGLRLGITSIDCLMHLGRGEVTLKQSSTDKLSRLGNYILNQGCFYPLYPPAKEINIDSELWEKYAFLKEKPHVLLLPSDMRYFCKHINESIILNPERLSKRTFAKMIFKPSIEGSWSQDNISCEIIKM